VRNALIIGVFGALITGIAIGVQSTLSSRTGALIGPIRTGLLTNAIGGLMAGVVIAILALVGATTWQLPRAALLMLLTAGAVGITIITGIAFSLPRTGVTAGLATIILGQLLVSVVVDSTGWGGVAPIPLDPRRLAGLAVMALAVYLLVPRN